MVGFGNRHGVSFVSDLPQMTPASRRRASVGGRHCQLALVERFVVLPSEPPAWRMLPGDRANRGTTLAMRTLPKSRSGTSQRAPARERACAGRPRSGRCRRPGDGALRRFEGGQQRCQRMLRTSRENAVQLLEHAALGQWVVGGMAVYRSGRPMARQLLANMALVRPDSDTHCRLQCGRPRPVRSTGWHCPER